MWCAHATPAPHSAPELFQVPSDGDITEAVDVWALGCTLFEAAFCELAPPSPLTPDPPLPSHLLNTLTPHFTITLPILQGQGALMAQPQRQ